MGKYHPHGDSAIYDTPLRMAAGLRHAEPPRSGPKVISGSTVDGDAPLLSVREAQLAGSHSQTAALLGLGPEDRSIAVETLVQQDFEPDPLPARFPNLLVSGAPRDRAVSAMPASIPPTASKEVCDTSTVSPPDPEISIRGPDGRSSRADFPTRRLVSLLAHGDFVRSDRAGQGSEVEPGQWKH